MLCEKSVKLLFYIIISNFILIGARSPWRPKDPLCPEIVTRWVGGKKTYHLRDNYLELHPLFSKFDRAYFMSHLLPDEPISYRVDPKKQVDGARLKALAQEVLTELRQQKTEFKHFKALKKSDYNFRLKSGLIILRYKEYPFVLKVFMKTPETFVKQSEGFIPRFFYRMGGGINRHLSGFTRIRNLEEIRKKIDECPYWKEKIDTPRKWFWLPEDPQWIELRSKHIGPRPEERTELPAVYGIIADFIESDKSFSLFEKVDREMALEFAHYVGNRLDAHVTNFMIETKTGKIVLVDTEHFPTMIGLKEPMKYDSYPSWYYQLSSKCLKDNFCRHKKYRRELQLHPQRELCPV